MLNFRHNVMNVLSLESFININGGFNNDCKDVYFVRSLGCIESLNDEIRKMDKILYERMKVGKVVYKRFQMLSKSFSSEDADTYSKYYEKWCSEGKKCLYTQIMKSEKLGQTLSDAFKQTLKIFAIGKSGMSNSIEKNFAVKMMIWLDMFCEDILKGWDLTKSLKVIADNITNRQEYLFFYMLTLIGCDVLLIQNRCDISENEEKLGLSEKFTIGGFSDTLIPVFNAEEMKEEKDNKFKIPVKKDTGIKTNILNNNSFSQTECFSKSKSGTVLQRIEKNFEELASLASSIVMIGVCDASNNIIGSGSGIMIGENGYILTNNHVATGGRYYAVRIEDDNTIYNTDDIIKYHPLYDLAIIRIQRKLKPVPVYNDNQPLARGQKVVAIGSPMGLFNTVSDGIISGFRKINDVEMIQFTAPISNGSSGGAVLNMYGEVIGISTAGIDSGQNLNLAISYECINGFIRGFI